MTERDLAGDLAAAARELQSEKGVDTLSTSQHHDEREAALDAREAALADRADREHHLLADAGKRDVKADARDMAANRREMKAALERFLNSETPDSHAEEAREAAASDRTDSRADRAASEDDRVQLTNDEATPPSE